MIDFLKLIKIIVIQKLHSLSVQLHQNNSVNKPTATLYKAMLLVNYNLTSLFYIIIF